MRVASKKAKGRKLQNTVRSAILEYFPELDGEDVRVAIMGENGADVKLTKKAQLLLGTKWETKNQEGYKKLYADYEQATNHEGIGYPVLVTKINRKEPLVTLSLSDFMDLLNHARHAKYQD